MGCSLVNTNITGFESFRVCLLAATENIIQIKREKLLSVFFYEQKHFFPYIYCRFILCSKRFQIHFNIKVIPP